MAFDIDRYVERSTKLDLSGIAWDQVRDTPLSPEDIRTITYMMDVETHTSIYLSELLVSRACMDPVITSFLSVWVYEEMFHGDALKRFLKEYGIDIASDRPAHIRRRDNWGRIKATLAVMVGSQLFDFFPAIYLTVGAINEMTTLTGYQQLGRRANHPVLSELLARIIKQERKHFAFYRSQAEHHLDNNPRAQKWTRRFLEGTFVAVGEGVKPLSEIDALAMHLFDGEDGRLAARHVDEVAGKLPGLSGVKLLERTLDRAQARRRPLVMRRRVEPRMSSAA